MKTDIGPQDAIARMRAADPAPVAPLRMELAEEQLRLAMRIAIDRGESPSQPVAAGDAVARAGTFRRGRPLFDRHGVTLVACLALAAAIALAVLLVGGPGGNRPPFAAAAIEVAEANPRLLVSAPGWSVTDAGEFSVDEGEVSFSDGSGRLAVNWYPARLYRTYLGDRATVSATETSTLLGRTATTVEYGEEEFATILAPDGPVFVEVRGRVGDRAGYDAVIDSLRAVDVETWLDAMPATVVVPDSRPPQVESMLRSVPYPPGFDLPALIEDGKVLNQAQLAVEVAGTVSCGWVESWLAATAAGDAATAKEAVDAMATLVQAPLMDEIGGGRSWASNVRRAAAELQHGRIDRGPAGSSVNPDGTGYELGPAWAVSLNCDSRIWHRPLRP